jgi:hypothetical protein
MEYLFLAFMFTVGVALLLAVFMRLFLPVERFFLKHLVAPVKYWIGELLGLLCTKCAHECQNNWCRGAHHFLTNPDCPHCAFYVLKYGKHEINTMEDVIFFTYGLEIDEGIKIAKASQDFTKLEDVAMKASERYGVDLVLAFGPPHQDAKDSCGTIGGCGGNCSCTKDPEN